MHKVIVSLIMPVDNTTARKENKVQKCANKNVKQQSIYSKSIGKTFADFTNSPKKKQTNTNGIKCRVLYSAFPILINVWHVVIPSFGLDMQRSKGTL